MNASCSKTRKVFTCTPVAFGGGEDFFARDSGLLCRGLRACGVESRAVMPGARQPSDLDELIRTDLSNLSSSDWWRALEVDSVVLYAWGSPKFLCVARAIREAGVQLVLNQDNGGLISPFAGVVGWAQEQWLLQGQGRDLKSWLRWGLALAKGLSLGVILVDFPRAKHLSQGDVIACVSPQAVVHYRRMCRRYGGKSLEKKVLTLPHAVEERFSWQGEVKRKQVLSVGRWADSNQKRPTLLVEVTSCLLNREPNLEWVIAGGITAEIEAWWRELEPNQRCRVRLAGVMGREALADEMRRSQVFYSPSAYESFGIAAAESLCCGCSVVAGRSVSMSAFEWFVSKNSGQLAEKSTALSHSDVLQKELRQWEEGRRNPETIASEWSEILHAKQVAQQVLQMLP